ncbi:MAG: SH3 domain-containing protein [Acidimicrobiia bacterium]|nr:SH3 domain-containing protein [Acidimicrobiia bacterium]
MRATVFRDHVPPDRAPLRLDVGDQVIVGRRDTQWPAFVFVTAADGEGWVPARYLSNDVGSAITEVAYDTAELAVAAGDVVTVVERDEESGWWWCRNSAGTEGWIPATSFEAVVTPTDD